MSTYQKLPQDFYLQDTLHVAKNLLGKYLIHTVDQVTYIGQIVETEAYLGPHDLACHTAKGCTPRTKIMFGPGGFAYVYLIYGMYYCFNVVTEPAGSGSAVLIRAVQPIHNIHARTQGPGLLCKAMRIDTNCNGRDLLSDNLYLASSSMKNAQVAWVASKRIGVTYAQEWADKLLRFYIKDNPFVSRR